MSTGDNAFLNLGGTDYEVGENRVARLKRRLRGEGGGVARFGLEPRAWLTDAREKGEAEIAGVETTHLSAAAEVPRMLDDLSGLVELAAVTDLTRDHRRKVAKAVGSARFQSRPRFDVYVRKDGVLRRLATEVRFRQAGRGRSLGGAPRGGITLSIDFSRIGEAQEIAAPPTARPLSALARLRRPRGSHDFPRSARRGRSPSKPDARSPRRDAGGADGRKTPEKGRAKPLTQGQLERYNRCIEESGPRDPDKFRKCTERLVE